VDPDVPCFVQDVRVGVGVDVDRQTPRMVPRAIVLPADAPDPEVVRADGRPRLGGRRLEPIEEQRMHGVGSRNATAEDGAARDEPVPDVVVVVRGAEGLHLRVARVEPALPLLLLLLGPFAHLFLGWGRGLARGRPSLAWRRRPGRGGLDSGTIQYGR